MDGLIANDIKFSSPMPAIGLYIAGATLVCLLLMLCDIFNAIRKRKPWIPCRYFVFNSFTLTLLSVATKLPSDLTTPMPSACDQLSKLCGTSLMCISLAFFRPSTVDMNESELSANLASLSIMVITIVVNVSLQISTGAIFLLKFEHALTLLLMLLMLGVMGCFKIRRQNYFLEPFRDLALKFMPRNIQTLKRCYIHSYITNPQLLLCRFSHCATIGILCTICFAVLSEAAIRAYCLDQGLKGDSDYKWSIWGVVELQILTLLVGTVAVACRCLALANQVHSLLFAGFKRHTIFEMYNIFLLTQRNWTYYFKRLNHSGAIFQIFRIIANILDCLLFLMRIWADSVNKLTLIAIRVVRDFLALALIRTCVIGCFSLLKCKGVEDDLNYTDKVIAMLKKEFDDGSLHKDLSSIPGFYSEYLLRKSVKDMEMCIKKHSTYPMHSLLEFLGRPAHDGSMKLLTQISKSSNELLLLVCLVRMADSFAPSRRIFSLASALDQAFEIIVFIHEKTNVTSASNTSKINVAKDIWMNKSIANHWFQADVIKHLKGGGANHIQDRVAGLVDKYIMNFVKDELKDIINIIGESRFDATSGTDGGMEELWDRVEKLFVELLHRFFDQLPDAIFMSLSESVPAVDFQKNAKTWMKLVARFKDVNPLDYANYNIGSFMTTNTSEQENEVVGDAFLRNEAILDTNVIKADSTHVVEIKTV